MSDLIEARLTRMGIVLPAAAAPAANYVPFTRREGVIYLSGQLPMTADGLAVRGRLGDSVSLEQGRQAARLCAINILAQLEAALEGDLERISGILRITGYVASTPGFTEQHLVMNGASDLLVEVLGNRGRHARVAIGAAALPLDAAVEIDAIVAVD